MEDAADDGCLDRVGDEQLRPTVTHVAVGGAAAHPFSFADAAFEAGGDAVDDGGMLELGEDTEHLQHHPTGR
ncbi:MAG TPA: hypothetical protein VFA05_02010 [Gaiellaceae bacterium]|nr:hypothetical protein [Gaiellaceae bacterium]